MQPHERFHAGFLIQLLGFVAPTYLHSFVLIEAPDGPVRYIAGALLASHLVVVAVRFAVLVLGDTPVGHVVFCRVWLMQCLGQIVVFVAGTGPKDQLSTRVYVLCLVSILVLPPPRLAHPRSSSSSAPAEVMPSLDERRPSLFTASDDSDEAATTRAAPAGEEGGAN